MDAPTPALLAAALWSGLLLALMIVLSIRAMLGRWKHRVSLGDGPEGQMAVLSRSFGNAAEYVPAGIGALVLLALVGASVLEVHVIGGALLLGRLLHPVGLAMTAPNLPRAAGMILTWLALAAAAVLLVLAATVRF